MKSDRFSVFIAVGLICVGVFFLAVTVIPGFNLSSLWPVIFFVIAAGFFTPLLANAAARKELSFLCIPGGFMTALGLIFSYNVLTGDWGMWAFGWLLLVAGTGLGLTLSDKLGEWGGGVIWLGIWMAAISLALFALLGMFFGSLLIRSIVPSVLIVSGGLLLYRSLRRSARANRSAETEPPPPEAEADAEEQG